MYKCEICGKEYENLKDRASCEWSCLRRLEQEEEQRKRESLKNERKLRIEEVNKAYSDYKKIHDKYVNDYDDNPFISGDPFKIFFGI